MDDISLSLSGLGEAVVTGYGNAVTIQITRCVPATMTRIGIRLGGPGCPWRLVDLPMAEPIVIEKGNPVVPGRGSELAFAPFFVAEGGETMEDTHGEWVARMDILAPPPEKDGAVTATAAEGDDEEEPLTVTFEWLEGDKRQAMAHVAAAAPSPDEETSPYHDAPSESDSSDLILPHDDESTNAPSITRDEAHRQEETARRSSSNTDHEDDLQDLVAAALPPVPPPAAAEDEAPCSSSTEDEAEEKEEAPLTVGFVNEKKERQKFFQEQEEELQSEDSRDSSSGTRRRRPKDGRRRSTFQMEAIEVHGSTATPVPTPPATNALGIHARRGLSLPHQEEPKLTEAQEEPTLAEAQEEPKLEEAQEQRNMAGTTSGSPLSRRLLQMSNQTNERRISQPHEPNFEANSVDVHPDVREPLVSGLFSGASSGDILTFAMITLTSRGHADSKRQVHLRLRCTHGTQSVNLSTQQVSRQTAVTVPQFTTPVLLGNQEAPLDLGLHLAVEEAIPGEKGKSVLLWEEEGTVTVAHPPTAAGHEQITDSSLWPSASLTLSHDGDNVHMKWVSCRVGTYRDAMLNMMANPQTEGRAQLQVVLDGDLDGKEAGTLEVWLSQSGKSATKLGEEDAAGLQVQTVLFAHKEICVQPLYFNVTEPLSCLTLVKRLENGEVNPDEVLTVHVMFDSSRQEWQRVPLDAVYKNVRLRYRFLSPQSAPLFSTAGASRRSSLNSTSRLGASSNNVYGVHVSVRPLSTEKLNQEQYYTLATTVQSGETAVSGFSDCLPPGATEVAHYAVALDACITSSVEKPLEGLHLLVSLLPFKTAADAEGYTIVSRADHEAPFTVNNPFQSIPEHTPSGVFSLDLRSAVAQLTVLKESRLSLRFTSLISSNGSTPTEDFRVVSAPVQVDITVKRYDAHPNDAVLFLSSIRVIPSLCNGATNGTLTNEKGTSRRGSAQASSSRCTQAQAWFAHSRSTAKEVSSQWAAAAKRDKTLKRKHFFLDEWIPTADEPSVSPVLSLGDTGCSTILSAPPSSLRLCVAVAEDGFSDLYQRVRHVRKKYFLEAKESENGDKEDEDDWAETILRCDQQIAMSVDNYIEIDVTPSLVSSSEEGATSRHRTFSGSLSGTVRISDRSILEIQGFWLKAPSTIPVISEQYQPSPRLWALRSSLVLRQSEWESVRDVFELFQLDSVPIGYTDPSRSRWKSSCRA
ncbi:hypothetical protein AGDE_16291 [Angomonas deanei]|uniref:Uncharacterized protein n=1 Tax=Angomonas deanei TaxID=59799 RepID=A0A7G2CNX8_9TRYP|nr:hypothetical protein AGDE_16291 [Angomonas deanei]CAD2220651.1 hypothetical protein, conserved [Angomonas deanei]|eukprot:EPY17367.1 hypothetical protein AGDE_16291 [Angomonas deanei]